MKATNPLCKAPWRPSRRRHATIVTIRIRSREGLVVRIEHSVVVERPPADVFVYLTEPANLPEWQASVLEARSDGQVQSGAMLTELRKFLGIRIETTLEVTEYEPNERFELRVVSGPASIEVRHLLTPTNRGTC